MIKKEQGRPQACPVLFRRNQESYPILAKGLEPLAGQRYFPYTKPIVLLLVFPPIP